MTIAVDLGRKATKQTKSIFLPCTCMSCIFQYIRMTDEDSVDNLIELMEKHWKIMEPERPNLVISVVGGAKHSKLDGRMRDTFSSGLIKVLLQCCPC